MTPVRMATPSAVKVVQVIEVKAARGAGADGDPIRIVTQYWDFDGRMLAEFDPHPIAT